MKTRRSFLSSLIVILFTYSSCAQAQTDMGSLRDILQSTDLSQFDTGPEYLALIERRDARFSDFLQRMTLLVKSIPAEMPSNREKEINKLFYEHSYKDKRIENEFPFDTQSIHVLSDLERKILFQVLLDMASTNFLIKQNCEFYAKTISLLWHISKASEKAVDRNIGLFNNENILMLTTLFANTVQVKEELNSERLSKLNNKCILQVYPRETVGQLFNLNNLLSHVPEAVYTSGGRDNEGYLLVSQYTRYYWEEDSKSLLKGGGLVSVVWDFPNGIWKKPTMRAAFSSHKMAENDEWSFKLKDLMPRFQSLSRMIP